jgi:hypothetical protein
VARFASAFAVKLRRDKSLKSVVGDVGFTQGRSSVSRVNPGLGYETPLGFFDRLPRTLRPNWMSVLLRFGTTVMLCQFAGRRSVAYRLQGCGGVGVLSDALGCLKMEYAAPLELGLFLLGVAINMALRWSFWEAARMVGFFWWDGNVVSPLQGWGNLLAFFLGLRAGRFTPGFNIVGFQPLRLVEHV